MITKPFLMCSLFLSNMSAWNVCKVFLCFILLINLPLYLTETEKKPTAGPYKTSIRSITPCEVPYRPYVKDPPILFTPVVYNVSDTIYIGGNFTVLKEVKYVKYRMKSFIWENNNWRINYIMNDMNCKGVLLHLSCAALNIRYDKKRCMYLKGSYYFKQLDLNGIQHLWASTSEYGKILWRTETYSLQLGTFYCYELLCVTEPI